MTGDPTTTDLVLHVNGQALPMTVDNRVTLLDALREHAGLTGAKKGCDHGQCGACTVLVDGRRANGCLLLAVAAEGRAVTTVEGVGAARDDADPDFVEDLHPLQRAFLERDGFQCGYCTPGQICSAIGALTEADEGWPSHVTADVADGVADAAALDDAEVRERMSGNLCRCGAYAGIRAAVLDVAAQVEAHR
ncbi:aldehyde dehydrogenase iron-sulfur subunit [Saccharopolyspora gloriosae]|uniref:Xanthine dehydrogenase YagT iron-sulfur-binding subunit n=1 Tax=Saccharopolyspora gloriosae TaxID=455344 RepID=A0A840NHK7_9PSEU|nr:2Fe-2S iron-sulfur cluster-binding protein [Saccharopolyspora gloriosae]MBB5068779.1 xanthine dehydrogenase YagT iron-sulfur-binding subunit [Saccharopolyspora gloriosae]